MTARDERTAPARGGARASPALAFALAASAALPVSAAPPAPRTSQEILDAAPPSAWRTLDPENTLHLDLPAGRVVIELAPLFAPRHVANVKKLARERWFDGLTVNRAQDGFVVQWGDPFAGEEGKARPLGSAEALLPAEITRPAAGAPFRRHPDADGYAPRVGFSDGFPAGRDPRSGRTWLVHCYGTVGAGRDTAPDSSNGTELYVVIGHAPRQLDRNITVVGRVVRGMEILATLPRGTGPMGFYADPGQRIPIVSLRVAANVPEAERPALEILETDGPTWTAFVESRRNRRDAWYLAPAGHVDLCNVPIPVREAAAPR